MQITDLALRPGENAVVSRTFKTGEEAASIRAEVTQVEFVAMEDGKSREEDGNYAVADDAFSVDVWKITSRTVMNTTTKISSRAAEEARVWLIVVGRDAAGKIVFSAPCLMNKVQPGTISDFKEVLTSNPMPELSSADIIILRD